MVMVNHRTQWDANTVDANFEDHAEMILKEVESVHNPGHHETGGASAYPGANFREYHIPLQLDFFRNDKFTGRRDVLERIHGSLGGHKEHSQPNVVVLHGMGGIGKTELAVEYAHLHQESYSSIFWIDCSTENSVRRSFLRIANRVFRHYAGEATETVTPNAFAARLGLKGSADQKGLNSTLDKNALEVVEAMRHWFAEGLNREWLLIFDNLDDLEAFNIMDYIPRTAWGSILITSRRRGFLSYGTAIEISEMSPEEGLSLLVKTARFGRDLNSDEQRLALKLLQSLGDFPLAIEQAGAYISQRISDDSGSYCRALENYLDSYERNAKMLLQYKRLSVIWSNRNDSALTTWEVSFNAIKQESTEASDLLQLCGFLENNDIFEEMFSLGRKLPANDTTIQESLSKLASYSLVSFRGARDAFSIHPLVHLWVRERLTLDVQQRLANEVVQLVARGLRLKEENDYRDSLSFEQRIIPHLDKAVNNMQRFLSSSTTEVSIRPPSNSISQSRVSILYDIAEGWYLWVWGAMSDISISCRHFLLSDIESITSTKAQSKFTDGHSQRRAHGYTENIQKPLEIAGDLAWAIVLQGQYDDASDWYSWLLTSRKKVLGKGHHATLGALKGLASISKYKGDYDKSLQLYFEALAGRQKRLGQNDTMTLNVMLDIAEVSQYQGKFKEALRWYERALAGRQGTLGEKHESTLQTINNIGFLFKSQGKLEEALIWYEQALVGRRETLGEKHKSTLQTIHDIGLLFQGEGKYEEALRWYEEALPGRQETLGEIHKDTLHTIHNIGFVFQGQGKYEEALTWYKRALAGRQKTLGEKHESTLQTIHNIGLLFQRREKYEEALVWYERALAGRQETLGEKHESTLHTIHNIGDVLQGQKKYEEALKWYERALAGRLKTLEEKHINTLDTIYNIGLVFQQQGEYEEALRWYEQALAGQKETLGESHKYTLQTVHSIRLMQ
ncbi:uncharacterized protein N7483_001542 [Penicillium malachiteum]|uniref:uncharacterized protein n=1 Tax=Penicillium malachiteum TaxID=1324776 RepID=UPI0025475CB1|nr:uncharacterized protein N7483_001542 [Penicillium malachiteum]KAJ5736417.1 hypothetical protein N7483_001542 [Penicillium malachiteum]